MDNRSYCVVTMPRSGSELLMHHLEVAYKLVYIGEFLASRVGPRTQQVSPKPTNTVFDWCYTESSVNTAEMSTDQQRAFFKTDLLHRIDILRGYSAPVVVKTFANSEFFKFAPQFQDYLFDNFNVVILTRDDVYSSLLSAAICNQIGVWHVTTPHELEAAQQKLLRLTPFEIKPSSFVRELRCYNELNILAKNAVKVYPTVKVVRYEQYCNSPTAQLNQLFNTQVESRQVVTLSKFIYQPQQYISNATQLRRLWELYRVT